MSADSIVEKLKTLADEIAAELAEARLKQKSADELEKIENSLAMVNSTIKELQQAENQINTYLGQPPQAN